MSRKFKKNTILNLDQIAVDIEKYWKKYNIYEKINKNFEKNNDENTIKDIFILYEGPPSLNGDPGVHHILSRTIKDIFCRYYFLKGKNVFRKSGWDTHGLPIELNVEKKIGINKNDIGQKISVKEYNAKCKKLVDYSMKKWEIFTKKLGFWIDLKNSFRTYDSKYIESLWWIIKKLYNKKLIYKGYTVQPYSPAAGTGLSYHELNLPDTYKEVIQISPFIKFKAIKNTLPNKLKVHSSNGNVYFLSWTTTPWTLPANSALAIGTKIDYVIIKTYQSKIEENFILSEDTVKRVFSSDYFYSVKTLEILYKSKNLKKIPYCVLYKFSGKIILHTKYNQLISWFHPIINKQNAFKIIEGNFFVNTDIGTGIVHIAPTFGIDDFLVSKKYNIPPILSLKGNKQIPLVDHNGRFINKFPYNIGGQYIKNEFNITKKKISVDDKIIDILKKQNKIFKVIKYKHFYPHCWRTNKPIIYYPLNSWFIKTKNIKHKMIHLNNKIKWHSNKLENKRFNSWLENIKDWNISRTRYWGTPIPIWRTKKGDEEIVIGSVQELIIEMKKSIDHGFMKQDNLFNNFVINDMSEVNYKKIDLHKHILDDIILVSPVGKKPMKREKDIIDVWFDSGAMPYAQFHYPFEKKNFINKLFPSNFVSEGIDQTRGWFFTLHALSTALFNSISYKNVIPTGLMLDKNGQKMSKSKGNSINPFNLIKKYGADSIRWYIVYNSNPWDNLKFNINGIKICIKKFFGTLHNIYSFFVLYANIDGFSYKETDNFSVCTKLDTWIISELNIIIKKSDNFYKNYNPTKVARLINYFVVEQLSNWYIRLCRRRFWKNEYTKDKIVAYQILYNCLITISKIISPIIPFISENIYINLNSITKKETCKSVHLSKFPSYNDELINEYLSIQMKNIKKVVTMILSLRKKYNIKIRQPLSEVLLILSHHKIKNDIIKYEKIILQETNIKKLILSHSSKELELYKIISPNYRKLGPRFGNKTKKIAKLINNLTQDDIKIIEQENKISLLFLGEKIIIYSYDVNISTKYVKGWKVANNDNFTIALNTKINTKLLEEGIIREFIRNIQKLRKKFEFNVTDNININIYAINDIKKIIQDNILFICKETLTKKIFFVNDKIGIKINIYKNTILYVKLKKVIQ